MHLCFLLSVPTHVCAAVAQSTFLAAGSDPVLLLLGDGRTRHLPQQVSGVAIQHFSCLQQSSHRCVIASSREKIWTLIHGLCTYNYTEHKSLNFAMMMKTCVLLAQVL